MRKLKLEELGRISVEEFKDTDKIPVVVIMDNVRSAHNIGSVFRTADAFLIEKVFLCGISPTPPNKEIRKTALGATESVDWEQVDEIGELIERLKGDGYKILSIEQAEGSTNLSDLELDVKEKYAVVFGNEVDGVQQSVINQSDICVEIPQGEDQTFLERKCLCRSIVMGIL